MAFLLILLFVAVLIFPILATIFELHAFLIELFINTKNEIDKAPSARKIRAMNRIDRYSRLGFWVETILYFLCFWLEYTYLSFSDVMFDKDWTQQLYNSERHQPIAPEYLPAVVAIVLIYLAGLAVLYFTKVNQTPPLITALSISALYMGTIYSIIWTLHISLATDGGFLYFLMLPFNTILISARLIIRKIREYAPDPNRMSKIEGNGFLSFVNDFCKKAAFFPIAGLILLIPLIGIMIIILVVFGQAPDSAIKAFTETSDFVLSTKVSPQNLYYDGHYLCTVAAGGDKKIVKPLRRGIRHGHEVTVNRQLEVANAFEEVIQVRTPNFHRHIRHFYDTYGFPIAKLIKKSWIADMVYFLMKPLEYIFVVVLYLTEAYPEDRIALQYTGTTLERFNAGKAKH